MRPGIILQALFAFALGAGAGAALLFGTGELRTPKATSELAARVGSLSEQIEAHGKELERRNELVRQARERAKQEAEAAEKAREAALEAERQRLAAEQEQKSREEKEKKAKEAAAQKGKVPVFGVLSIRSLSNEFEVDAGTNKGGRGRNVEVPFVNAPTKLRIKAGRFTVVLAPKVVGAAKSMLMDVSVTPMALVSANDNRIGPSAFGLAVERKPFKLDIQSPAVGDLNLILTFRR